MPTRRQVVQPIEGRGGGGRAIDEDRETRNARRFVAITGRHRDVEFGTIRREEVGVQPDVVRPEGANHLIDGEANRGVGRCSAVVGCAEADVDHRVLEHVDRGGREQLVPVPHLERTARDGERGGAGPVRIAARQCSDERADGEQFDHAACREGDVRRGFIGVGDGDREGPFEEQPPRLGRPHADGVAGLGLEVEHRFRAELVADNLERAVVRVAYSRDQRVGEHGGRVGADRRERADDRAHRLVLGDLGVGKREVGRRFVDVGDSQCEVH